MSRLDPIKEAKAALTLRESIQALGEDEQLALDTIEGETSLFEAIDLVLERIGEDQAMVVGTAAAIDALKARQDRFDKRIGTGRALIEQAMMVAEIEKIERPTATLSLSKRQPKVEISDEAAIPSRFWRPADPRLDKKAVGDALKAGESIPGACLSNAAPSLTIRTA